MIRKIRTDDQITNHGQLLGTVMIEAIYLGLGVILLLILNTAYVGWRGSQQRRAEAERNNPFGK